MNDFVINTLPDISCNISNKFVYNFFNPNEDIIDDNIININTEEFSNIERYVDINILYKNNINCVTLQSFLDTDVLDKLRGLDKSEINRDLLEKIINFNNKKVVSINMSPKKEEILLEEITNKNLTFSEYSIFFEQMKNNKKIHISPENKKYFISANNKTPFLESFKKILNQNNFDFLKNYNSKNLPKQEHSSFTRFTNNIKNHYCMVGFLLEKYSVNEDDKLNYKSCVFLYNRILDNISSNSENSEFISTEVISLKDQAVKYGSTYKYYLTPIYLINLPQPKDYYYTDFYFCRDTAISEEKVVCKEYERPHSTSFIKFKYLQNKFLMIDWAKPVNTQGDIFGYQIFKRDTIDEPFKLVKQIEFLPNERQFKRNENIDVTTDVSSFVNHVTTFIDKEYDKNKIQIYTICTLDARGYSSNYSQQYAIYYNFNKKNISIDLISPEGAPLNLPNLLIPRKTKLLNENKSIVEEICFESGVSKISVYLTPDLINILDDSSSRNILSDIYKFNIFSLDKNINHISNIRIT
jgi:hypothetical protein